MKKLLLLIAPLAFAILVLASPLTTFAQTPADEACAGIQAAGGTCDTGGGAQDKAGGLVRTITNTLSWIVGAVAVIMIIIGGFRYLISGGDSNGVSSAKNTIMYALIGLLVVIFAQVIVAFVYSNATKSSTGGSGEAESSEQATPEAELEEPAEGAPVEE